MTNTDTSPPPATLTTTAPKPGYQTTEFWLKVAAFVLTALYASGVIPTSGTLATAVAIAATMLGALGYTVSRTFVKNAAVAMLAIVFAFGVNIIGVALTGWLWPLFASSPEWYDQTYLLGFLIVNSLFVWM